ncbi:MAG: restriction endonuclease subunit S [Akkermansiaceae bacterium]|nr:restriction endonuclease subunit S [Akkermansiaceae bacterium]
MSTSLSTLKPKLNPAWASLPLFDRTGWKRMAFGEFAESIGERAEPKDAQEEIYVGLEHLDPQCLHIRRWGKGSDVIGGKLRFRKGDIIFGKRRAYQRKLAVAEFGGICSAHAMVIRARPDKVLPEFLPFLMMSDRFMNRAVEISVGSLSPTINWTTLKLETFDLPPLDQQRRIAEILWAVDETLCSTIEMENAGCVAATVLLKVKMLGSAPGEVGRIRDIGDYRPTDGWKLAKARELVCSPITKGATPSPHLNTSAADVPFLKVYNLTFTGDLDFTVNPTFVERAIHERVLKRSRVRAGDILMNLVGPPLGKVSLVPADFPEANVNQAIAIYRIADAQLRDFFLEYLQSDLAQRWLQSRSKKTSGQQNLTLELAQELPVPIPPSRQLRDAIECSRSFGQLRRTAGANRAAIQQLLSSITNPIFSVS